MKREDELRRQTEQVASSHECTGLVPALTEDAGEAEERRLYDVEPCERGK